MNFYEVSLNLFDPIEVIFLQKKVKQRHQKVTQKYSGVTVSVVQVEKDGYLFKGKVRLDTSARAQKSKCICMSPLNYGFVLINLDRW